MAVIFNRRKCSTDWNSFPCEVYIIIFRKLEARDLISCLFVTRKWRSIIKKYLSLDWQNIAKEGLWDGGTQLKIKSKLDWWDLVIKSARWKFGLKSLKVETFHTYTGLEDYLPTMAIYKDKLYVCTKTQAECFSIETCETTRLEQQHREIFFADESDYIRLLYDGKLKIRLIGKKCTDDDGPSSPDAVVDFESNSHVIYALDQDRCHILSDNQYLWTYTWENKKWESKFVARHYGSTGFSAMIARYKKLYFMGKHGDMWTVSEEYHYFTKLASFTMPVFRHPANSNAVLNTMLSVCPKDDYEYNYVAQEISKIFENGVSCATFHAGVLLLAFSDRQVQAFILDTNKNCDAPEFSDTFSRAGPSSWPYKQFDEHARLLSLQLGNTPRNPLRCHRYDLHRMPYYICHMAVYEGVDSSYLFVNYGHSVYQYLITFPGY